MPTSANSGAEMNPRQLADLKGLLAEFGDKKVDKALKRAGGTAARQTRTQVVRQVARVVTLKQKDIRPSANVKPSVTGNSTRLVVKGGSIPMHKFSWGQQGGRNPWGYRQVWVKPFRAGAKEPTGYVFPLTLGNGSTVLVERKKVDGKRVGRGPLRSVRGPAVPSVLAKTPGELPKAMAFGGGIYIKELDRQISLALRR